MRRALHTCTSPSSSSSSSSSPHRDDLTQSPTYVHSVGIHVYTAFDKFRYLKARAAVVKDEQLLTLHAATSSYLHPRSLRCCSTSASDTAVETVAATAKHLCDDEETWVCGHHNHSDPSTDFWSGDRFRRGECDGETNGATQVAGAARSDGTLHATGELAIIIHA